MEWALRADSLISGKLAPQDLDASFAKQRVKYKEDTGPSWWTAPRVVRVIAFVFSAASLGTAIYYDSQVKHKLKDAKDAFEDAENALVNNNYDPDDYREKLEYYDKKTKSLRSAETPRNIFYISAGTFGVIGLASFAF